jgi:hypothetical protein
MADLFLQKAVEARLGLARILMGQFVIGGEIVGRAQPAGAERVRFAGWIASKTPVAEPGGYHQAVYSTALALRHV